jgi:hypothetical protein
MLENAGNFCNPIRPLRPCFLQASAAIRQLLSVKNPAKNYQMRIVPKIASIYALLSLILLSGCVSNEITNRNTNSNQIISNANSQNEKKLANDNIEELETIIKIPFHPEEALWREEILGNPANNNRVPSANEKKLTAVLKFTAEEADKIVRQAEKIKTPQKAEMESESWFPPELIAKSQESGNETIKGISYPADDFFQSPYSDGKITRIEGTNFFVLELYSR